MEIFTGICGIIALIAIWIAFTSKCTKCYKEGWRDGHNWARTHKPIDMMKIMSKDFPDVKKMVDNALNQKCELFKTKNKSKQWKSMYQQQKESVKGEKDD